MTDLSIDKWGRLAVMPRFLALASPRERRWWRLLLSALVVFLAFIFGNVGGILLAGVVDHLLTGNTVVSTAMSLTALGKETGLFTEVRLVSALGAGFGLWILLMLLGLKWVNGRAARTWVTSAPRIRWRLVWAGVVVFGVILAAATVISWLFEPADFTFPVLRASEPLTTRLWYAAALLVFLPPAAMLEEVLCRGWMMQTTALFTRNLAPILVVNSLIFSALHLDPDPGRYAARAFSGFVWSWAAVRLGGIKFGIGAHAVNNILLGLFVTTISAGTDPGATAAPWQDIAADMGTSALLLAAVELILRRPALRRLAGLA